MISSLVSDSSQYLPPKQRLYQDFKPKLAGLIKKYPRISYYVDDQDINANLEDVLNKIGFQSQTAQGGGLVSRISQFIVYWLKRGDLTVVHYRSVPNAPTLIDLLREIKRKAPYLLNVGLVPVLLGQSSSSKQQEIFRVLGRFGIQYCIFLDKDAPVDVHMQKILEGLVEYDTLLTKGISTSSATGAGAMVDISMVVKYRELVAKGEELTKTDPREAIKLLTQAIELMPDFSVLIRRGDAYYKAKQFVEALIDYREANRLEQRLPEPYARVSACCFKIMRDPATRANPEAAKKMYDMGMKYLADAERLIEKMEKEHSHLPERLPPEPYAPILSALSEADLRGLGMEQEEGQLAAVVLRTMEKTKNLASDNADAEIEARLHKGIILTRYGYYEDGEKMIRGIFAQDSRFTMIALMNLGLELQSNGQYAKAIDTYMELLRYDIGDRALVLKHFKQAADIYTKALRNYLKFEEALVVYKNVLLVLSKSEGKEWILCDIAMTYLEMQDQAQASFRLMEAIYINPQIIENKRFKSDYQDLVSLRQEMMKKLTDGAL